MATYKKIIKITKKDYQRLQKEYGRILDLYISDNVYYIIGTIDELKALDLDLDVPFY